MLIESENWLPVVGMNGYYEVSDLGRLRSVKTKHVRVGYVRASGHRHHYLKIPGSKPVCRLVHALVLAAFVGPRPEKSVCRHLNGNPLDNRLANLKWGTHLENSADMRIHGRLNQGARNGSALLTAEQIPVIRESTDRICDLARQFGVAGNTIRAIKEGRTWRHI